jgi:hypothetical protein
MIIIINYSTLQSTSLWQLTNGKKLIQFIFSGNTLIDCEIVSNDNEIVQDFVDKFIAEYQYIRESKLNGMKHAKHQSNVESEVLNIKSNVKFIQLKRSQDIPEHIFELMNMRKVRRECNHLHRRIRQSLRNTSESTQIAELDSALRR